VPSALLSERGSAPLWRILLKAGAQLPVRAAAARAAPVAGGGIGWPAAACVAARASCAAVPLLAQTVVAPKATHGKELAGAPRFPSVSRCA